MLKKSVIVLFIVFSNLGLYAQFGFGKVEDIQALKERTLLVELKVPNKKKQKKLAKKPEKLANYENAIKNYNNSIKKGFEDWEYSKNIEFVSLERINEIKDDKKQKENYSYFRTFIIEAPISSSRGSMPEYTYEIGLADSRKPIYRMQYDSFADFNEADAIFITQQFDFYFKGRIKLDQKDFKRKDLLKAMEEEAKMLKEKTLYLDKDRISSGLEEDIKTMYNYNYKFASKEEIDKAIINKSEDVIYVKFVPVAQASSGGMVKISKRKYAQYFVDAETGKTVAFIAPGMSIGLVGGGNSKTSKGDLKSILKMIE